MRLGRRHSRESVGTESTCAPSALIGSSRYYRLLSPAGADRHANGVGSQSGFNDYLIGSSIAPDLYSRFRLLEQLPAVDHASSRRCCNHRRAARGMNGRHRERWRACRRAAIAAGNHHEEAEEHHDADKAKSRFSHVHPSGWSPGVNRVYID